MRLQLRLPTCALGLWLLLASCSSGAGPTPAPEAPCRPGEGDCGDGEQCILASCDATTPTCRRLCDDDIHCTGLDSDDCVAAADPRLCGLPAGQPAELRYCGRSNDDGEKAASCALSTRRIPTGGKELGAPCEADDQCAFGECLQPGEPGNVTNALFGFCTRGCDCGVGHAIPDEDAGRLACLDLAASPDGETLRHVVRRCEEVADCPRSDAEPMECGTIPGSGERKVCHTGGTRGFDEVAGLRVLGGTPAVEAADGPAVRCGEQARDPSGVTLRGAFLGTGPTAPEAQSLDRGIRPGDLVGTRRVGAGIALENPQAYELELGCIDPLPDADADGTGLPSGGDGHCQGVDPGSGLLQDVGYDAYVDDPDAATSAGHRVLVLLDQSGSTIGQVIAADEEGNELDAEDPLYGREAAESRFPQGGDFNFLDLASDPNAVRHAATRTFIEQLDSRDRVGVLAFGEGVGPSGLEVPCEAGDELDGDAAAKLEACFGTNAALWDSGISNLENGAEGRANLWEAVDVAYDFFAGSGDFDEPHATTEGANHVVVVTDGPDTCSPGERLGRCQASCSSTSARAVLERIRTRREARRDSERDEPHEAPIHVHFVQFESAGYPGRDPRQIEVACSSRGHYQFVNSEEMSKENSQQFRQSLTTALLNLRHALMGSWRFTLEVSPFANDGAPPQGSIPGRLYGLSGEIRIGPDTNDDGTPDLRDRDAPLTSSFGVGEGGGADEASQWDRRPTVRKACTEASDCAAAGGESPCRIICSAETLLCPPGGEPLTLPDGSACGGDGGSCCDGTCRDAGEPCPVCE